MYGLIYRFGRFDMFIYGFTDVQIYGFIYRFILFCINWILVRMLVRDFVFTIIRNKNPNENIKKMADKLPQKIFASLAMMVQRCRIRRLGLYRAEA